MPKSLRELNRTWYGREKRRPRHFHPSRYHSVNLHAVFEKRTIEIRPFNSTNDKFTFRVWLVGLGPKGKEFKTARKHLTANLSGRSAWRYNQTPLP